MTTDNYTAGTALTAYFQGRSSRAIARHWAVEKLVHDLASVGILSFFEGAGDDPTSLSGYATSKLWLRTTAGVTSTVGTIRYWNGGTPTLLASWPVLTPDLFADYLSSISGGSALTPELGTYTPAGTGATLRTIRAKLRETDSVEDYGATGDGVTDDTTAFQAALTQTALLGKRLFVPNGTYLVSTLTIPSGLRIDGQSWSAVLKKKIGSTSFVTIDSASDVVIKGLAFDMNADTGADGNGVVCITLNSTSAAINGVTIERCKFSNTDIRPFIDVRTTTASANLKIVDNEFYGRSSLLSKTPPTPQQTQAIRALCTAPFSGIRIERNYFNRIGMAGQFRPSPDIRQYDYFPNLSFSNNEITNVLDDPNVGAIPLELFSATNGVICGNAIDSGGRGLSASHVKNSVYAYNTISNQTIYFIETSGCDGVVIANNSALNCKRFLSVTDTSAYPGQNNMKIVGNFIKGGNLGITGYNDTENGHMITMIANASTPNKNWTISNNTFIDNIYTGEVPGGVSAGSIVRIDNFENFEVKDNLFIANDERAAVTAILVGNGRNATVSGNRIIRTANVSSDTYDTLTSRFSFITLTGGDNNSGLICEGNVIDYSGTDTRVGGTNVIGIGNNASAAKLPRAIIRHNVLRGAFYSPLFLQYSSGDIVVENNDLSQAVGGSTLNAAIVWRLTKRVFEASASPTTGTYDRGDRVINSAPSVGQPKAWTCTVAGTAGTLSSVTGDIDSADTALTVNDASALLVGQYITIAGVTGIKRIAAISGTSITIDSASDATVTGAAVAWSAPTFVSEGNL